MRRRAIRRIWRKHRLAALALGFFLFAHAVDIGTSVLTPKLEEQNAFARDTEHHFLPGRAIKVKLLGTAVMLAACFALYVSLAKFNKALAQLAFAAPLLWYALDVWLNADFINFLLWLGWYQP